MESKDYIQVVAEIKNQLKGIKNAQAESKKLFKNMRAGREQQKTLGNPKSEKVFAKAVSELETLIASQDALAKAAAEAAVACGIAGKALKKYHVAAAKANKNVGKVESAIEKVRKLALK